MPKLNEDIDDMSDVGDIPSNGVPTHVESAVEADVEAKNQLQTDIANDVGRTKGSKARQAEIERVTEDEEEDDDDGADLYEVEAIRGHEWRYPQGKRSGVKKLVYNVKWKGYPETDNTLEPEENLKDSRDLLAQYHHEIGGAPQPEVVQQPSKKRSTKNLKEDSNAESLAEDSPAPSAKRQKRTASKAEDSAAGDDAEDDWGAWTPASKSWENDIREIQTVERDPKTKDLYILIVFKNGKKSKVKREMVHKRCPLKMLEFYENHLNFSNSEAADAVPFSDTSGASSAGEIDQ